MTEDKLSQSQVRFVRIRGLAGFQVVDLKNLTFKLYSVTVTDNFKNLPVAR